MRSLLGVMVALAVVVLQGCGLFGAKVEPPPPPPPPTRVALRIVAAPDINPDGTGQAAPVQLRIYELRGASAFESADFFSIYDKDQAALGADLAGKKELLIRPGEGKMLMLEPGPDVKYLGAFAAYRRLEDARWRADLPIIEHRTTVVEVRISGTQLSLEVPPVAPLPPP